MVANKPMEEERIKCGIWQIKAGIFTFQGVRAASVERSPGVEGERDSKED